MITSGPNLLTTQVKVCSRTAAEAQHILYQLQQRAVRAERRFVILASEETTGHRAAACCRHKTRQQKRL